MKTLFVIYKNSEQEKTVIIIFFNLIAFRMIYKQFLHFNLSLQSFFLILPHWQILVKINKNKINDAQI